MEPTVNTRTDMITFANGASDILYEINYPAKLELNGVTYWLCNGHEQIVIWDTEGKRVFETYTR
jgi:hypothetical protein